MSHHASGRQWELNAEKSTQHGDGVVAPQSAVAPNYVLWHAYDPAWHPGISGINKLPLPPNFFSGRWADFIRIIVAIAAEAIFMAIVMLARVKTKVRVVFFDIGFERPVLSGSQTRRWRGFAEWNDMIVD